MEKLLLPLSQDLMHEFGIREDSIEVAPFQGEMCTVFNASSGIHGALVVKTALRNMQLSEEGQREIRQNKEGYDCIPSNFRPEILASDQEDTFLVMPNVGKPLRDLLWENRHSLETCVTVVEGFLGNLSRLFRDTKIYDFEARNVFLDQLQNMGQFFLQGDFFTNQLRNKFVLLVNHIKQNNDSTVAFATLDLTQGNLLIDVKKTPQTLIVIDPKKPRLVRSKPSFLGISEIDLGMFFTTLSLNAPNIVQSLRIEEGLKSIGQDLRDNTHMSNFYFELGKLFGCILIASFPNTVERVETYLKPLGVNCDENTRNLVIKERERHVQKAIEIANNIDLT